MHDSCHDMTLRVGRDMPLAAPDLLARVITAWTAVFSSFNRLAVNNAYRRRGVSPVLLTRQDHENMVHRFPSSLADLTVEIALHGRESGKVTRQLSPRATRSDDMEDRLHDPAQIRTSWSPQSFPLGHQRRNQRPLRIAKVACILQVVPLILRTGDFSPGHLDLIRFSQANE
ncbi:hypothetical protein SXCC_00400 [Gluconacetobacter sp. SXCC-1]|nr:hypothetical protein SXCC_00400 [Gluconacetobacter sp. SXCC-1]